MSIRYRWPTTRKKLLLTPESLTWARRQVFEAGRTEEEVARALYLKRTTLHRALTRHNYGGYGNYRTGVSAEVVEVIRWLGTLPKHQRPKLAGIARVFRTSCTNIYHYWHGRRRKAAS
jgi:hypothetical protein